MAITKTEEVAKIEVVETCIIQIATDTLIKENDVEISRTRKRHSLSPCGHTGDGVENWTWSDTDISGEDAQVQAVANAVWTDTVKANYKTFVESQEV